jgi:hypothetical protein
MSNAEMENNRKIVQDGLNKRASKRSKAIIEAEHEIITVKMFSIVNTNACNAESRYQSTYIEAPVCKANKKPSKKLIRLRNVSVINACTSFVAFIIATILYFIGKTELLIMIATSALPVLMFIYNIVHFAKAQKKLKWRK